MNPFWRSFFDGFKDRGRDGTPFLLTVALMVPVVFIAEASGLHVSDALPWVGALMIVSILTWSVVAICRARRRRNERWQRQELSSDEWRVARSKLKKDQNVTRL